MPSYAPQKYFDLYPLDSIQLPPHTANDLDDVPAIAKVLAEENSFNSIVEHNQWKQAIQGYLASASYADAQVGRVLDALNASPYKDNTIVVLISDHGFHIGEKQHWQKGTLWEEATHALMMFRVPGLTKPGHVCERTVTLLDLYPTLVELAGLPKPSHLDGHSLVPLLKDAHAPWSFAALSAYQSNMSVRTDEFRLIRYKDGTIELYDKAKDPQEWVNQANKPEYAETQRKLASLLPAQEAMAPSVDEKGNGAGNREDQSTKKNKAAAKEE
jgi:arylsulfatase A-like enzyme